jgi:hypothetical protein
MITCYFVVDPSINPDLLDPIQLPNFLSDLFGIHKLFPPIHLRFSVEIKPPSVHGAKRAAIPGKQHQRQELIVSGFPGGCPLVNRSYPAE